MLRGRAAWIVAQRGDLPAASALMRPVLVENPDYAWGWYVLADWARESGTAEEYLEAAEALARLWPEEAVAHAYLGEARLRNGNRAGAKESFRRALALDPGHGFAAMSLFDLELEDEEIETAGTTLAVLKDHADAGDPYVIAREVQWTVARADRGAAMEALGRLCVAGEVSSDWPWQAADRAIVEAGSGALAESTYASALERSDAAPLVGELWVERWATRRAWRQGRRLKLLLAKGGEAACRALAAYIRELGKARARIRLAACLRAHKPTLRRHTLCWAMVGFALTTLGRHRAAARWLADWPSRSGLQPWMLYNLVLCLRSLDRHAEAARASRHALDLPADSCTPYHGLSLALDDLVEGRPEDASDRLEGLDPASLDAMNRYLYGLALILRDVERTDPATRRGVIRSARRRLLTLNRSALIPADDHAAVRQFYRRAVHALTRPLGPWLGSVLRLELLLRPPHLLRRE